MIRFRPSPCAPLAAGLLALGIAAPAGPASAQETTLIVHHFLSPNSATHTRLIEPWAERIETQSDGRIAVEIFPAMAMGGKPPELYSQVRDGVADAVWTLIGYTPGVFPRAEVFELPTVHGGSAEATTRAIQARFDLIAGDFEDIHPLMVHVHAGNALHLRGGDVSGPADLEGLKLRTPSRTGAWAIEAYGAEPVGMPVPALPQALARGVVDGALVPFEIMAPLKLQDLTALSIEGQGGERFGTSVFLFAMNRERYEDLPDDLKAVIDANAGANLVEQTATLWDSLEEPGKDLQRASGGRVVTLSPEATQAFHDLGEQVVARWIEGAEAAGIDGEGLVEAARDAIEAAAPATR